MDDLISRQAAIDANCLDWCNRKNSDCEHPFNPEEDENYWCDGCSSVEVLKKIPSVQTEIVRCRDCKWWDRVADGSKIGYCHAIKHCYHTRNWEIDIYRRYEADFYCADGEMRTEEEEEEEDG